MPPATEAAPETVMTVLFVLLFTASNPATPQAVFETRKACSAYAVMNYNKEFRQISRALCNTSRSSHV
jgi:hypothetical protein